jgi:hypothetical protein
MRHNKSHTSPEKELAKAVLFAGYTALFILWLVSRAG